MKKSFAISDDRINNLKQLTSYKNSSAVAEKFKCSTRINNLKNKTIQTSSSSRTVAIRDKHIYSSYENKYKVINGYLECCKSNNPSENLNQVLENGNNAGGQSIENVNAIDAQTITLTSLPIIRSLGTDKSMFSNAILTSNGLEIMSDNGSTAGISINAGGITNLISDNTTNWEQIQSSVNSTQAISLLSDSTKLVVNNTLMIQNGEPDNYISIISDTSGNHISINGNYGLPNQLLLSGGYGDVFWSSSGGELAGTLGDVLANGNTAYNNINMNGHDIVNSNLDELRLKIDPTIPTTSVSSANSFMPVNLNENTYYIQLFNYTV